jgi:hypothetical protein
MTKTRKPKLPKRIGGVKLTKELRKAGGKLIEKASSPIGRELIAAGLSMAAAAATAAAKKERDRHAAARAGAANDAAAAADAKPADAKPAPAVATPHGPKVSFNSKTDPHEIGVVLGNLAQEMLGRVFAGKPKG